MAALISALFFLKSFAPTTSFTRWKPYLVVIFSIKKLILPTVLPLVFWKMAASELGKLLQIFSKDLPVGSGSRSLFVNLGKYFS